MLVILFFVLLVGFSIVRGLINDNTEEQNKKDAQIISDKYILNLGISNTDAAYSLESSGYQNTKSQQDQLLHPLSYVQPNAQTIVRRVSVLRSYINERWSTRGSWVNVEYRNVKGIHVHYVTIYLQKIGNNWQVINFSSRVDE